MTLATVRLHCYHTNYSISWIINLQHIWVISVFCIAVIGESLLCYSLEE